MTNSDSNPIDALEGLLEERRRYEGWIAQLEERRATSPSHVVDRVRSDYLGRLEGVTQQLRGRASDLEGLAAGLRARISTLMADEGGRRDERAELELRALVGEFDPERAQQSMSACDEAIGRLTSERGALEHELRRITDVLAMVAPPSSALAPQGSMAPPSPTAKPALPPVAEVEEVPPSPPAHEPTVVSALETRSLVAPEPSPIDELAFLQSVVESPREPQAEAPAPPEGEAPPASRAEDDLLPPPVLTAPRRPTPLSSNLPPTRESFAGTPKASTLTPGSMPSFLKDMPTEQVKTLKCQECGTMNYPTEWYCERCGGELAAM